ncbi:MAG: DNA polymerase III subunit epsilon [Burkholderiaceae bacterium]|nr:DNA polymerase III subunit epsilon [Burkholderiaceae bacterium]
MTQAARQAGRSVALWVALAAGAVLAWAGAAVGMLWATLEADERTQAAALLGPRAALLMFAVLMLLAALGWAVPRAYRRWVAAPAQLVEEARVLLATDTRREITTSGDATLQALAAAIVQLAAQRDQLKADIAEQVRAASRGIEQERNRLAALMSELTQAVVVCNLDGRILLYNGSARAQFRALSQSPGLADGAELIGLGRSIHPVIDRRLLDHALEKIEQLRQRGLAQPSAQFITSTAGGQLLRVQVAPVHEVQAAADGRGAALNGYVLLLANVTREFEASTAQDQLLLGLTEGSRASLGNLSAALEMLDYPDLDEAQRQRFQAVVHDEVAAMRSRLQDLAARTMHGQATRWPLEEMLGADLVAAGLRRIEAVPGLRTAAAEVDATLWLRVDSFSLLQALASLAGRLHDEYEIKLVQLRLAPASSPAGHAHLDLMWTGQAMSTETVMSWETDAMQSGGEASALSVRDVVQRHGGEFWFERERVRHQAFFRFLLPTADAQAEPVPGAGAGGLRPTDARPEYYDFDLFRSTDASRALDERPLAELSCTVFDTETTGLEPSQGDEIIQIGATRIVNGRLRRQESFEQLVDPQRSLPAAGIAIHGITPAMVAGQPTIAEVLPAFHAFALDTVLVAHNAAFDMRFLQLKEAATGLRFDQPVLDTLLLSAVVHPQQESHSLEAIAQRLGIAVQGRHTALADALVTAEVFLKLVPLLEAQGIRTLGQAREAAQKTFYARVTY